LNAKKILLISSEFPPGPGGIGQHAYTFSLALVRSGYSVRVLTHADYTSTEAVSRFDAELPFTMVRFQRVGVRTYEKRIKLAFKSIREWGPTHIILTGKFPLWLGLLLNIKFAHIKTVAILHGSEVNLPKVWQRLLTHYAINSADEIVAVSIFTASLLPKWVKNRRYIKVIPNGILISELEPSPLPLTNHTHLTGSPKLLTIGHVSKRKGQHRVIKALPGLIQRYPNVHYHIVGRPVEQESFLNLANTLGVINHVTFHGMASTHSVLSHFYQQSDIFMLLSENQPNGDVEGFGIVALEANYWGIPVIGALYCGVEDAVSESYSGYLVDGNDVDQIVEAVKKCVERREVLAQTSKNWALTFDWNNVIQQFIPILK
jgi:phosphatidylinositol alpha-1,6-mannosyltransferase